MSIAGIVTQLQTPKDIVLRGLSVGVIAVPTVEGLEYTLSDNRLHYSISGNALDYELPNNKLHYSETD